jgi:hypothetical protein
MRQQSKQKHFTSSAIILDIRTLKAQSSVAVRRTITTKKPTTNPASQQRPAKIHQYNEQKEMVTTRVELATLALLAPRSNQLS